MSRQFVEEDCGYSVALWYTLSCLRAFIGSD